MTQRAAAGLRDVITPLLTWGITTNALDALDVVTLQCVSKETSLLIKWEDLARLSSSSPGVESKWEHRDSFYCEKCSRQKGPIHLPHRGSKGLCMHCQGIITPYSACTVYKLQQTDIQHLACVVVCTMQAPHMRWTIAIDLRSVVSIALIKHRGPEQLRKAMIKPRRVGNRRQEQVWRLEDVNKMIDKLDLSEEDKMLVKMPFPGTLKRIVKEKQKGAASVGEACAKMKQYEHLMEALSNRNKAIMKRTDLRGIVHYSDLIHQDRFNSFNEISDKLVATQECYDASTELLNVISPLNVNKLKGLCSKPSATTPGNGLQALLNYLRPISGRAMRQRQLSEALAKHSLLPRSDSRLCRAYTNEEEPFPLEKICSMMQEMKWLVKHTSYQEVFASKIKQRATNSDAEYNRISKSTKRAALQVWTCKKSAIPADIRSRFENCAFI